ncbi:MAG TPA: sialidase family protein [Actinoplanes sp.]
MGKLRKLAAAGAAALLAVGIATPAAAAPRLVVASPGDPFAGCTIGGTDLSTVYPGAEVEPSVATDPKRPARVVGAWQQDRWSDGGARGLVAAYSTNGGRSFHRAVWPLTRCSAGGLNYERASDPWVSTGPDGIVYGSGLSFDATTARNAVVAITSYDGGRTWRNITSVIADEEPEFFNDKNSVTADPVRRGSAYQVWDRLEFDPDSTDFIGGPTLMSSTRDGGRTWSPPRVIVDPAPFQQTIGNVIVGDPRTGHLYDVYTSIQYTDAQGTGVEFVRFEVVRSTDGGRTWGRPVVIASDTSVADVHPNTGEPLRTGAGLPFPAVDPRTGALYVAYEGSDFTGGAYNQIQLVRSTDHGRTWSAPVRVSRDRGVPAFTPSIAVTRDGDVGVTYYDLRTLRPTDVTTLPTSTWLAISPRGGRDFAAERRISPVFDHLLAPNAGGYFLGDYQGLATSGDRFRALFVTTRDSRPGDPTAVYYGEFRSIDATHPAAGTVAGSSAAVRSPTVHFPLRVRR